jgi:hypothetical protein
VHVGMVGVMNIVGDTNMLNYECNIMYIKQDNVPVISYLVMHGMFNHWT